ncbi:hypothetical protein [Fulvivirga sediminis]|uniref:DUF4251 domain-containing protein n=1 Tax=Fulvivirga sediminis TaxID=2803949 RepID=A0A937K0J1_9BACT|nr:hypothetical protein [Fulvivirga sediminis]MBL3656381.1 hypothetical protein [Fulvivirga sediminis]
MKYFLNLSFLVVLSAIFLISCSDDDDDESNEITNSYFKVAESEYSLKGGTLVYQENLGEINGVFFSSMSLMLHSEGIEVIETEVQGEGFGIYLNLLSLEKGELASGEYKFGEDQGFVSQISEGEYEDVGGTLSGQITSGAITVEKKGDNYEITLDLVNEKGQEITGYYNGKLTYYDDVNN